MVKKRRTAFKFSKKNKIAKVYKNNRKTKKNHTFRKQKGGWGEPVNKPKPTPTPKPTPGTKPKTKPRPRLKLKKKTGGFWGGTKRFYTTEH